MKIISLDNAKQLIDKIKEIISAKADRTDLSNVLAEEVVDQDTYQEFDKLNREDLKKDLFIDLWNSACKTTGGSMGKYNANTGYFELNGLTDITYEQAKEIYTYKNWHDFPKLRSCNIRTNLPYNPAIVDCNGEYFANSQLEIFNFTNNVNLSGVYIFSGCKKLHTITGGVMRINTTNISYPFGGCDKLQNIKVQASVGKIDLRDCLSLTFDSIKYSVRNSSAGISIYVHPDIYNALTGNATYPFNGGTQEEWTQLLEDAVAKNITFTTV